MSRSSRWPTAADGPAGAGPRVARGRRPFVRYPQVAVAARGSRAGRDVIYATATYAAASAAAAARRPLVAKLVSDPAYERAWRYGSSAARSRTSRRQAERRGAERRCGDLACDRHADRRAERLSRRDRREAGVARRAIEVLINPAPPPADVSPITLGAGYLRLRRTPDASEGPRPCSRRRSARFGAHLVLDRRRAGARAGLERQRPGSGVFRPGRVRWASRATRCSLPRAARRGALERLGEPAARRGRGVGRRHAGRRDGRRRRARGRPRRRERPPRAGRRPGRAGRCAGMLRRRALRERLAAAAKPSVAAIGREPIYTRLEAILRRPL